MLTPTAIDLSSGTLTTDAFAIASNFMTVQVAYTGVDGNFQVIPLQSNDESTYDPILDEHGRGIAWRIVPPASGAGNAMFNIPKELYASKAKLKCMPVGGKYKATAGTVTFTVMNS